MATFEQFPFTDYQDLNIDWVLRNIKDLLARVKALEDVNVREIILEELQKMIEDGTFDEIFDDLLDPIRARLTALESLTAGHTLAINELNSDQARQDADIAALRVRLTAAETAIEELRAAIQILDPTGEIGDIAERIAAIENALAALTVTVQQHTTQITQILQRLQALENGGATPLYLQYEQRDITGADPAAIRASVTARDGTYKIGNYWTGTYTDPETLGSAAYTAVIADIDDRGAWILIRSTKPHVYNSVQFATNAGYGYADIRTYADMLGEALFTAMGLSPVYRTYPIFSQAKLPESDSFLPAEILDQSHCCILLSSLAYFGQWLFTPQYGAFTRKLPLYDHENLPHGYIMYDFIVTPGMSEFTGSALSITRTVSRGLQVPYAVPVADSTAAAQPAEYAIRFE